MRLAVIVLAAVGLGAVSMPAAAQSIGEPLPGRKGVVGEPTRRAPPPAAAARPCPEYGPGFIRLENSSFCVRAGGSVRMEYGVSSGRYGRSGTAADTMVGVEARGQTALGEVRTVIGGRVGIDRGAGFSPYR